MKLFGSNLFNSNKKWIGKSLTSSTTAAEKAYAKANLSALQSANYAYTYPTGPQVTTPGTGTIPNSPNTWNGTYVTNTTSSGLSGPPSWDTWDKEEKKCLTKIGFKYDPDKGVWRLSLTATVELPQEVGLGVMGYIEGKTCIDQAITLIKDAKDNLIKKLKAKAILLELTRPKEIKE